MSKQTAQAVETAKPSAETIELVEKRIPLKIRVFLDSFKNSDGEDIPYVAAELLDPFPEYLEDFNHVRIAPRWKRDIAIFKFRMRHYLRSHDDVTLEGYCVPVGFASKKAEDAGIIIYYPGIFFNMPYAGAAIEFAFKQRTETDADGKKTYEQSPDSYVFRDIVAELWGGSYEPAAGTTDPDAIPDDDQML